MARIVKNDARRRQHPLRRSFRRNSSARGRRHPPKGDHLQEDIRLLGRLLGEAVREHEGDEAFERIETIRRLSVAASRHGDTEADAKLDQLLRSLSSKRRSRSFAPFSYFLHLGKYRRGSPPLAASRAGRGVGRQGEPWLGAEPRPHIRLSAKSRRRRRENRASAGARMDFARAHRASDRSSPQEPARTPSMRCFLSWKHARNMRSKIDLARNELQLRARVSQMWQTECSVSRASPWRDEIENTLSYYRTTFLRQIPHLLRGHRATAGKDCASRLSWPHGRLGRRRPRRQPPMSPPTPWRRRCACRRDTALRF